MDKTTTKPGNPEISKLHEVYIRIDIKLARRKGKKIVKDKGYLSPQVKQWKKIFLLKSVVYTVTIFR